MGAKGAMGAKSATADPVVSTTLSSEPMTEDERKKRMQAILDKHDQVAKLMREALSANRRSAVAG